MSFGHQLRVGAFGVGRMGLVHLEHLARLHRAGEIELLAVGDRWPETLQRATEHLRAWVSGVESPTWTSHTTPESMADLSLDAVVIASRTIDHPRDSLVFLNRAIPVLAEKPLANSVADAFRLSRQLNSPARGLLQIAFQRYFDPATELARQWFTAGQIGELQQSHHVLQDKNPTPPAYQSAGITADMAIHLIFEALSFHNFELPRTVQALQFLAPHYEDRAGEGANVVHAFCTWPDGSVAHLWGSRINNTGYDNGFKLIGTQGRIDVGEFVGDWGEIHARLWQGTGHTDGPRGQLAAQRTFAMSPPRPDHPDFYARFGEAYAQELQAFLQSVRHGSPPAIGWDVGWKTLLVANVAEASSRRAGICLELTTPTGSPLQTLDDAYEFVERHGIEEHEVGSPKSAGVAD